MGDQRLWQIIRRQLAALMHETEEAGGLDSHLASHEARRAETQATRVALLEHCMERVEKLKHSRPRTSWRPPTSRSRAAGAPR